MPTWLNTLGCSYGRSTETEHIPTGTATRPPNVSRSRPERRVFLGCTGHGRSSPNVRPAGFLFPVFTLSLTAEALNPSLGSSSHSGGGGGAPMAGREPLATPEDLSPCQHLVLIKRIRCQFSFEFAALRKHEGVIGLLSYYMYCFRLNETSSSDDSSKNSRRRLVSSDHIQPLSMIIGKHHYEY